jgi:Alternative complex III, ActD subunit
VEDTAVKAMYALYSNPDSAQYAVDQLRHAGIADADITVIASQPYEEYEFSHRYKETWIFWIAAGGGAVGLLVGLGLALLTEVSWPLNTGGMPIVAWWPNIIIMFELTMLGAILATVVSLFITAELPAMRSRVYDPEVANGKILVAVEEPKNAATVEQVLKRAGVDRVRKQ